MHKFISWNTYPFPENVLRDIKLNSLLKQFKALFPSSSFVSNEKIILFQIQYFIHFEHIFVFSSSFQSGRPGGIITKRETTQTVNTVFNDNILAKTRSATLTTTQTLTINLILALTNPNTNLSTYVKERIKVLGPRSRYSAVGLTPNCVGVVEPL